MATNKGKRWGKILLRLVGVPANGQRHPTGQPLLKPISTEKLYMQETLPLSYPMLRYSAKLKLPAYLLAIVKLGILP
jgi:hypothetical protein